MSNNAVKMAQYLNLSWTGFYPLVKILGRHMKTEEYSAKPTDMHGRTTIGIVACKVNPITRPTISPEFTNTDNLFNISY